MPELAIIVPTYNERENLAPLAAALEQALGGIDYEMVVVDDDSADGTSEAARQLAQRDARVRIVQRIGRRGLSSAVVEGMLATSAPYLAVIDGDLQHDERILPRMLETLKAGGLDVVVGSRNTEGGSMGEFSSWRVKLSNAGRQLSRTVSKTPLSDPMSGFFLLDRRFLDEVVRDLSSTGFKILLDLLASARRPVKLAEVPYTFRQRTRGESKLDVMVSLEYLQLILDKWVGDYIPVTYVIFGMVGAFGVLVNLMLLFVLMRGGLEFATAFLASSCLVIAVNYFLNNAFTFRAHRLRGAALALGLIYFYLGCGVGLAVNLQLAHSLRLNGVTPWLAGLLGITLSSVWNYWITTILVWRVHRKRARRRNR